MTSLAEVYEGHVGEVESLRRLYLGIGLFAVGTLLVVTGIVAASTTAFSAFGLGTYESRHLAGVLAGLGGPSVFVGVFTILPASRRVRAAAAIGASVAILGVSLFWYAYPTRWYGAGGDVNLTLPVAVVYFIGTLITFACLFIAVANFKTRNDPGGMVALHFSQGGETRTVEVSRSEYERAQHSMGGVGFLGDIVSAAEADSARAASDGGSAGDAIQSPMDDAEVVTTDAPQRPDEVGSPQDVYCGNCAYFDYVRTDHGIQPYCGLHRSEMEDMDACDDWISNNRR